MAITVTHELRRYNPDRIVARFVRHDPRKGAYQWCEFDARTPLALRQGTCDAADLPENVRHLADKWSAVGFAEWPR